MASLFVIRGRDQGRRFELNSPIATLGRDHRNDIQLQDTEVSRRHAELRKDEQTGQFLLVDLDSSNGSFVNSQQVSEEERLRNGDRIQLGRTLLIFTAAAEADSSSMEVQPAVNIVNRDGGESRIIGTHRQNLNDNYSESGSPWLARARSNLQVMYRTALAVSHTLDIDQLLERIMGLIFEWVEADRGCIMLLDAETEELMPAVRRNRNSNSQDTIKISRTILDYVRENKEGVLTSDARDDARWDPAGSIVSMGVREAICVPMQGRYGVVGVIYIDTYTEPGNALPQHVTRKFSDEHLKLMVAIGHQAALAVEDTSYYSAMVQSERLAAMGQTIATLSHHIKNILQGIRGGSYLIEEGLKSEATELIRKGWGIVDKNQEKISNLVMDMLSFSKEREPQLSPDNMNRVVADVVELMQSRARELGVQLEWIPCHDLGEWLFDADAMHRAVLNVVTNALDACQDTPDGKVQVRVEQLPRELRIVVEDNGSGIAAEDLNKIFSVFESRKGSRGTGLGLPVSQKILREHQGDIHVESEPGVGTRFVLSLPAVNDDHAKGGDFHAGDTIVEM
ncbi:MAG: FHA domain-containing protein [Planctomycetales bacterium]|nr:FHA domain-containing protein [Planctomycetales bacterium]